MQPSALAASAPRTRLVVRGHHVRDAEPTRQRRARDHHCRCGLETANPRSEAADPLPKESFYHALRVTIKPGTATSTAVHCTADLLQISLCKSQPTAGRLPLPLSNLYLHTARVGLWTDRLEAATGDLRFFVCRFVSRCVMYASRPWFGPSDPRQRRWTSGLGTRSTREDSAEALPPRAPHTARVIILHTFPRGVHNVNRLHTCQHLDHQSHS